jgi:hypothetical protein
MSFRGGAARLLRLSQKMIDAAKAEQKRVGDKFADWALKQLIRQHQTGVNIYGKRFPLPKSGGAPMLDSGDLASAYDVRPSADGTKVVYGNAMDYSDVLNRQPARVHLPKSGSLPQAWRDKIAELKADALRRFGEKVNRLWKGR